MLLKNGQELTIEKARVEDAQAILDYLNLIGGESDNLLFGANGFRMSLEDEIENIETLEDSTISALLVGKIDGQIVSVGSISSPSRGRTAHQSDVALSVLKSCWGLGIGTLVMQALIDFARHNVVCKVVHLSVRADNERALRVYEKCGFERIGVYKKYMKVGDEYFDCVLMNLYL